jgi:F-type H+-transporting ATPase subunit epsilon
MGAFRMELMVLLPYKVFAHITGVKQIVAETDAGSFGILPHRLDCTATMVPGILAYEKEPGGKEYLAVDEGILVKAGTIVYVSVRNAIGGAPLGQLKSMVEKELKQMNETETDMRSVMAKLEGGFIRKFEKLKME